MTQLMYGVLRIPIAALFSFCCAGFLAYQSKDNRKDYMITILLLGLALCL